VGQPISSSGLAAARRRARRIPLGFRADNIRPRRSLFAARPAGVGVKVDPRTLAVREVVTQADTLEFGRGAVEVGDALARSFRGNRIVIVPAP
jgi:hypothetical protein